MVTSTVVVKLLVGLVDDLRPRRLLLLLLLLSTVVVVMVVVMATPPGRTLLSVLLIHLGGLEHWLVVLAAVPDVVLEPDCLPALGLLLPHAHQHPRQRS